MSAKDRKQSEHLNHLVDTVLRVFIINDEAPSGWDVLDEDTAPIAAEILDILGPDNGFTGPEEVVWFLSQRFETEQLDDPPPGMVAEAAAALWTPRREFAFEVPLLAETRYLLTYSMGGPHSLEITSTDAGRKSRKTHRLSGVVQAATDNGAVAQVERVVDAFLGAAAALGLARFFLLRHQAPPKRDVLIGKERKPMAAVYSDRLRGSILVKPRHLSEPEEALWAKDDLSKALMRTLRLLRKVMAGESAAAGYVRNACRITMNAISSHDNGIMLSLAFSGMEGLLLSKSGKEDVVARLAEAVAHSLETSFEGREQRRKQVKELYGLRSEFVHTGQAREVFRARQEVTELLFSLLKRSIRDLPEPDDRLADPELTPGK